MKRISFFALLACTCFSLSAQPSTPQQVIDSLNREIRNAPDDTTRIKQIVALAKVLPSERYLPTLDRAMSIARRGNYVGKQASLHMMKGNFYYNSGDPEKASKEFSNAALLFEQIGQPMFASNMYFNAAMSLAVVKKIEEALPYMELSFALRDSLQLSGPTLETLTRLGQFYIRLGNVQKADPYFQRAKILAQESDDHELLLKYHSDLVTFYGEQRLYDSSYVHAKRAIDLCKELKDTLSLQVNLVNSGILFTRFQRGEQAIQWLDQALTLGEYTKHKETIALVSAALAEVMIQEGKCEDALLHLQRAESIFPELPGQEGPASVAYLYGEYYECKYPDSLEVALPYYLLGDSLAMLAGNAATYVKTETAIGKALIKQEKYNEGIQRLEEALTLNNQINYLLNTIDIKEILGEAYLLMGEPSKAIGVLEKAAEYVRTTKEVLNSVSIYSLLARAYFEDGKLEKAYLMLDTAGMYRDTICDVNRNMLIEEYAAKFGAEQQKFEISQQKLALAKQRNYLLLALLGLGGLSLLLFFFWRRSRRNKQLAEQSQLEVQELAGKHQTTLKRLEENKQKYQQAVVDLETSRKDLEATQEKHEQTQEELAKTQEMYEMLASAKDVLDSMIPLPDGMEYPVRDVIYFKKENNYLHTYTSDDKFHLPKQITLEEYQEKFCDFLPFLRIHKSHIINLHNVKNIDRNRLIVTVKNGDELRVTSTKPRTQEIFDILDSELEVFRGV